MRWRALPAEHRYRIDASRVRFEPGAAEVLPLETRHVASATAHEAADAVTIEAYDMRPTASVTAELRYPAGGLIDTDPAWRSREAAARRFAPRWAIGGAAALRGGAAHRVGDPAGLSDAGDVPLRDAGDRAAPGRCRPRWLPCSPAKGRASGYHPLGTLLDLADRGVLVVKETPGRIAGRRYELSQVSGHARSCRPRRRSTAIAFAGSGEDVPLAQRACASRPHQPPVRRRGQRGLAGARPARSRSQGGTRSADAPSGSRCCSPACSAVSLRHRSSRPTMRGRSCCRSACDRLGNRRPDPRRRR